MKRCLVDVNARLALGRTLLTLDKGFRQFAGIDLELL